MKNYKDLIVWQKAHRFVLKLYKVSDKFPRREDFVLTSQMRRAAISIPANIAEGFKKQTATDTARFLNIAQGSLEEVRYYLILAKDLAYVETDELAGDLDEVGRLLYSFRKSILSNGHRHR